MKKSASTFGSALPTWMRWAFATSTVAIISIANVLSATAGIEELEVYPWDLDSSIRCYADDALEASRPPTTYASPLELETQAVRVIVEEKTAIFEEAQRAYEAAQEAAEPVYDPRIGFDADEVLERYQQYLALMVAELTASQLSLSYSQNSLDNANAFIQDPGLTLSNLFDNDPNGNPVVVNYLEGEYGSASGTGDLLFGIAEGGAAGEVLGAGENFLATAVTGEIRVALAEEAIPRLEAEVERKSDYVAQIEALVEQALDQIIQITLEGITVQFFRPATPEQLEAVRLTKEAYDIALGEKEIAERAYYEAFTIQDSTVPDAPFCDSREFGVALIDFCAAPRPQVTAEDEALGLTQAALDALVGNICGRANDALEGVQILSNGGEADATIVVPENQTSVTTIRASQDGFEVLPVGTLLFSISGADAALFSIDADTGILTFNSAPNFEQPEDANSDNEYELDVKATDENNRSDTQSITIIISNIEGPDDPDDMAQVEFTQRVISNFMTRRAKLVIENEPDLTDRIKLRGKFGNDPVTFRGRNVPTGYTMTFSTSLTRLSRASVNAQQASFNGGQYPNLRQSSAANYKFDIWAQGTKSHSESLTSETDLSQYHVGVDYMINDNWVVGMMAQTDIVDESDNMLGTHVEGVGWMAGPYIAGRLDENLYFDGRVAWGQSDNSITPFGTYTDDFDTNRYLASGKFSGDIHLEKWTITPHLGIRYFSETQKSYIDGMGATIPKQTISLGQVSFGPKVSRQFTTANDTIIEPYVKLTGYWNFDDTALVDPNTGRPYFAQEFEARTEGGVAVRMPQGWQIRGKAFYGGIADRERETYGASIGMSKSF